MHVAVYVRISTTRQQQTHTLAPPWERLWAHSAAHPSWHLANAHIDRDEGDSGASLNRPGRDRLRDHAAFAAFERVLITSPDRLARRYVHQVVRLDEWARVGCEVECLERPMSQDPHEPLLLQIRGVVAA